MAKRKAPRQTRNTLIEIIKILMRVERVTITKLVEDLDMNRSNIGHRIKDLEEAGIVQCYGQLAMEKYGSKRPRVYGLSSAFRSTQNDASGTPGPA